MRLCMNRFGFLQLFDSNLPLQPLQIIFVIQFSANDHFGYKVLKKKKTQMTYSNQKEETQFVICQLIGAVGIISPVTSHLSSHPDEVLMIIVAKGWATHTHFMISCLITVITVRFTSTWYVCINTRCSSRSRKSLRGQEINTYFLSYRARLSGLEISIYHHYPAHYIIGFLFFSLRSLSLCSLSVPLWIF